MTDEQMSGMVEAVRAVFKGAGGEPAFEQFCRSYLAMQAAAQPSGDAVGRANAAVPDDGLVECALSDIKLGMDFAYEQGLHEFFYDPVMVVREALTRIKGTACRKCHGTGMVHENTGPKVRCSLCGGTD